MGGPRGKGAKREPKASERVPKGDQTVSSFFTEFKALARIPLGLRKVLRFGGVLFVVRRLVALSFQGSRKVVCRSVGLGGCVFEKTTKNMNADSFKITKKSIQQHVKNHAKIMKNLTQIGSKSFKNP